MGFVLIFTNGCKKDEDSPSNGVTDIDGNIYDTVAIGTQVWMVENLKTTKYNDGTSIPLVTVEAAWSNLTTPGYCFYDNDAGTNKATYGAIYNWYTVNTGKLCPTGWHVPSDAEWTTLTNFLGGEYVAGGKLKQSGISLWSSPNDGATNWSGFTALPAGYRQEAGSFCNINDDDFWWSTTTSTSQITKAWSRGVNYNYPYVYNDFYLKSFGYSVRCLRN
ncbi:MAG: fibrobacter succinogenes major paralogous domain-containing protein [Bacteroidia bacterium]|nr:fibrobacter succinogenes major paralogous domain-containing protein [Bacteroidia bacterium]